MPPSYSPCPRPILKRTAASAPARPPPQDEPSALLAIDPSILSPLVRFPHHQALAHTMGSALPYDRTPIVVTPNRCALPERGCPGRTYSLDDPNPAHMRSSKRMSLSPTRGKHLHPRAAGHDREAYEDNDLTPRQSPRVDHFPLPPLVPDLSSESSEESDGIASPPPEFYSSEYMPYTRPYLAYSPVCHSVRRTWQDVSRAVPHEPHPGGHQRAIQLRPLLPPPSPVSAGASVDVSYPAVVDPEFVSLRLLVICVKSQLEWQHRQLKSALIEPRCEFARALALPRLADTLKTQVAPCAYTHPRRCQPGLQPYRGVLALEPDPDRRIPRRPG